MARPCRACVHPKVNEINKLLIQRSASYRDIGGQYGLDKNTLYRHRAEHLPERLTRAANVREMLATNDLMGQVGTLQETAMSLLSLATQPIDAANPAKGVVNPKLALSAIREARENARLLGEIEGRLKPQGTTSVNVAVSQTQVELPSNGRGPGERAAALAELQRLGQLPPILLPPPPSNGKSGDGTE